MSDLVASVKRFAFLDRSAVAQPTDVAQGLTDTVAVLAAKARTKSVVVTLDLVPGLPLVAASTGDLNQAWSHLLDNALDAVAPSGCVTVTAALDAGSIVVCVIDDGPGVPAELVNRIFDPFFTTKPVGQGTGLGLEITRQVVRLHDGQISVESRPGRTVFRVSLPVA